MHPPMRHALPPSPAALSELAYSRFSDELKEQAHKEYLASLERYRQGQEYLVPAEFVLVAGSKGNKPQQQ